MYWHVKAFFALIVLSVLGGGGYLGWKAFGDKFTSTDIVAESPNSEDDSGKHNSQANPEVKVSIAKSFNDNDLLPDRYQNKLSLALRKLDKSSHDYQPTKAVEILRNMLKDPKLVKYSKSWERIVKVLGKANTQVLFSDMPSELKEEYVVRPGDSLNKIATKLGVNSDLLKRINNNNTTIFPKQVFRVHVGSWNLRVSKKHLLMTLYDGDDIFKVYEVGLGKENRTPIGNFYVQNKAKNPSWYDKSSGRQYAFGDPQNPLGTRWMSLKATGQTARNRILLGYGIHGTADPNSIRKYSSRGCMRMFNEDVEELYDIIKTGTPLIIEE